MKPKEIKQFTDELWSFIRVNSYDNPQPPVYWLKIADKINSLLATLAPVMLSSEQGFNKEIKNIEEKEGCSNAKAKATAKAGDNYANYRKYEILFERGKEKIRIAKSAAQVAKDEYIRGN